ncbi:TIGR04086 family membrane protein [Deinococcus peraridilitoris]|uniref:PhnA-like protein n=1 Tax=Deinococcus peraridilitoris (strain DSM 19664 / LMG 22246 / CIP 109416 / KR-200) TaxID=937777 RepID=L0A1C9_DEIPD|nr:TIGR04086 family membrane protein [Deinococcus peraridilitoris]AFZ67259.1 hypothetical protein Deipe_1740 [Deinococcus peraridilitoris DSM 19664]
MLVERGTVLQRLSWTGILAGLVVGIVTQLALTALGVALGAATIDTARGLAIGTIAWLAVSLAISAFLAGLTAARAAGYLTPAQGRFNGLLTGMLLALGLTLFSYNALMGGIRSAIGLAQGATAAASSAAGAANQAGAAQSGPVQQLLSGLTDEQELNALIAEQSPELSNEQVAAASGVVRGVVNRAVSQVDLSNLSNLNETVPQRFDAIQQALTGEQLVTRLQRQGLSEPEARETATVISSRVQETRQQAEQSLQQAEQVARRTASTGAWSWLLATGLILLFSTLGGGRGHDVPQAGATLTPNRDDEQLRGRRT